MKKSIEIWSSLVNIFNLMPFAIRYVTIFSLVGGILFISLPCMPFTKFHIDEKVVSQTQFWASGYGPCIVILGIVLLLAGIGFIFRKQWSIWLVCILLLVPIGDLILHSIVDKRCMSYQDIAILPAIAYFIYIISFYLYFFKKRTVRNYFKINNIGSVGSGLNNQQK